jgi:hypothetical protein
MILATIQQILSCKTLIQICYFKTYKYYNIYCWNCRSQLLFPWKTNYITLYFSLINQSFGKLIFSNEFHQKNLLFFFRINCSTMKSNLTTHTLRSDHRRIINIGQIRFLLKIKHRILIINMEYRTCPGRTSSDRIFTFSSILSASNVG